MSRLAIFLALVACSGPVESPTPYQPTVVRVECPDDSGWGSGVRLDGRRVVTAQHVAECFPDSLGQLEDRDVAIVPLAGDADGAPAFRAPTLGEAVTCWGYPGDPTDDGTRGLTVTSGVVANLENAMGDEEVQITCPVRGGMSGGPVLGADGAVVGLVVSYYPGIAGWAYMEPVTDAWVPFLAASQDPTASPSASGTK